ncbi:hypothetical protein N2152v2_004300 [Parachlorella kessleri]
MESLQECQRSAVKLHATCQVIKVASRVEEVDLSPSRLKLPRRKAVLLAETLPSALLWCTSLRAIDLGGSHLLVTDELLDTIAGCCGTLRELRLNYCESFSALGLQTLALGLTRSLEVLSLVRCTAAVGNGQVLLAFPYLKQLDVTWCRQLDRRVPARLPSCVESLNLHGCEEVDDESLSVLSMPHLTRLNLAFAVITDDGLRTLVEGAPSLRHLTLSHRINNLWNTGRWTEEGLAAYKRAAPQVEVRFISS